MSTPAVTPDQQPTSNVGALAAGQAPPTPDASSLPPTTAPAQSGSRLGRILGAIANVADTGLAGIPDKGRPNFVSGLGEGARAEEQSQANQQNIKFKTFDDQLRAAQLHNQDLTIQNQTQAQADAHEDHINKIHENDGDWGITYDTIANHGDAVMDHLATQTAANGAAVVPPGTHISGDGETILIPKDTPETNAGQLAQFKAVAPALGLNVSIPDGATKLDPKVATVFYNKLQGFDAGGNVYTADKLPGLIASNQAQRDALAKNGGTQVQLDTLDGILTKQKAQLKADNDALDQATQRKTDATNDINTTRIAAQGAQTRLTNAAKPQKVADSTELNAVAFDPNYQNPDGSKGANVVMAKSDAAAKGLSHYKVNPDTINTVVAGFNDVQNKINMLADVTTNPDRMSKVQAPIAAALLKQGFGLSLGAFGSKVDLSSIDTGLYGATLATANQATRDYVTAIGAAHEAITQLPRLQTFGKSNRMTQQQMEAAQKMLPFAGDDAGMAQQKMTALQTTIDPLKKQVPRMSGADLTPSWLEQRQQQQQTQPSGSNLGRVARGSANDVINGLK